jgi:enoyl-CoA hydratase
VDGLVSTTVADGVATLTMDDGKVNVLSLAMQEALHAGLDEAEAGGSVVLLTGRPGVFSAGFDLPTLQGDGPDGARMLRGGFELSERLLSFPTPVVVACTGHAIAMGLFLVLSGDLVIGADGPFKLVAIEVAIGMTLPMAAVEVCRQRLTPAAFNRATILAETFPPGPDAVAAGILDQVVAADDLAATAREAAVGLTALDLPAHAATKLRTRGEALAALRGAIDAELLADSL